MKVCILTEAGKNIGFGHITRCTSIYQAFEDVGVESQLIINGDENVQYLLRDTTCEIFDWLNDRQLLFEILNNADIVFIDSYLADYDLYEKISNLVKTVVYFDDDIRIEYPRGIILNGAVSAEGMPYPKREDIAYLLGTRYTPLRKEFWDVPAKPIGDNLETIMITFGGADIHNLTPKVLKLLTNAHPEMLKKVIIGKGFKDTTEIEKLKDSNTELIYYPNAAEMKKVMLESDIAISACGQTLYELARTGTPVIGVCTAENQLQNIRGWEKVGFIECAGQWADEGLIEIIKQKIDVLKSKSTREYRFAAGKKLIDGKGSSRIVKELLSNSYKDQLVLRKATFADALDIFNLANEDIVRKSSFVPDKIEWNRHLEWFEKKLNNKNCLYFVVDCLGGFGGQVRFDITPERKEAIISISLERNTRGLGLSSFIISKSIKEFLKTRKEVKFVKAYIKNGNSPSIKSFGKAGFKFLENTRVHGCKCKVYEIVAKDAHK